MDCSLQIDVRAAQWQKNGAGLFHSHEHGFGLMKAWRMVNAAKVIVFYVQIMYKFGDYFCPTKCETVLCMYSASSVHVVFLLEGYLTTA